MSQWSQGQPFFQYPMQTGFSGGNFQQARAAPPPVPPLAAQFQQSQPSFLNAPPPVPPLPAQFQQNQPSFLNAPPPQPNHFLSASPGFGGGGLVPQQTGFGQQPGGMLMPQMTGYIDPRLQMMSQSFIPMNTSAGVPQLQPQPQNLVQSFQQHNQAQRGTTTQQLSWALTKAEKKSYDNIFRQWVKGERFMSGPTAIEVFGASGLSKDDLARVWTFADIDDRGKLNLEEFHIAMGLIYRRLNGMQLPDQLPRELIPSSHQDLGDTVDRVKELLERESRTHSPSSNDSPISILKNRSFYGAAPSFETNRDATIYKHTDEEPTSVYKPKWRHVDRDAIRSRDDEDNPSADLQDLKRKVANTAQMLDRAADADALRTKEDEELAREMSDLNYRVKRIQEDLEFNSRGTQTASRANERRRLERELLSLMHERIPEVERKIKDREERKEREKRQWARDRDGANERFGRYDNRDEYSRREDPYSRGDDRDRPYSRGEDRDRLYGDRNRPYSRGDDRPSSRGEDRPYSRGAGDREDRDTRERSYDRPRSPPATRNAPRPTPTAATRRDTPPVPSQASPSPSLAAMTPEQRKAYTQEQAKLRIQARMTKLGVISPSTSSTLDTSVEDRLQQEKKEAEEKAKAAEKQAEEREKARRERVENAKALKEGRTTPGAPTSPTPTSSFASSAPVPKPPPAPTSTKTAPPPPKPRSRNAPAPPVRAAAPIPTSAPSLSASIPKVTVSVPASPPMKPEVDPVEEKLRAREEALRKSREEREKARQERERKLKEMEEQERAHQEQERASQEMEERERVRRERERALQELEEQEAAAARLEEEQYQQRLEALKTKATSSKLPISPAITSPSTQTTLPALPVVVPSAPDFPPQSSASAQSLSPAEKSTNPFSRLLKEATSVPGSPALTNGTTTSANPWAKPQTTPLSIPSPSRSPAPISAKTSYQTAPSSAIDDDWEDVKEKDIDDGDSSDDDELMTRSGRADIARALFESIRRPSSAAPTSAASTSSPVAVADSLAPPPPPPPPAPVALQPPAAAVSAPLTTSPAGRGALFAAIQGGKALRPTKTTDKSRPPLAGRVIGDNGPPTHINASARSPSPPPAPSIPSLIISVVPETPEMANKSTPKPTNLLVERLPSTFELDESKFAPIPDVLVDERPDSDSSLMADIDKSTVHRARSLYVFEGDGQEDLSFDANVMIVANPSKSGGDWWYGKLVTSGKSGLFPKTYVAVVDTKKAHAVFSYPASNSDELSFTEGDTLDIVDTSEEEWWKAERGGEVFMVPAGYLELVEVRNHLTAVPGIRATTTTGHVSLSATPIDHGDNTLPLGLEQDDDTADDSDLSSEYHSFDDGDSEDGSPNDRAARERERQLVLEAAGLIVQTDLGSPLRRRSTKRRPAPATPDRNMRNGEENLATTDKDLPPIPSLVDIEIQPTTPEPELSYEARLDDAYARYEAFKNRQATPNRLSVVSIESSAPASSQSSSVGTTPNVREPEGGRYSNFFNFLRSKTPDIDAREVRRKSASTLNISAPIIQSPSTVRQNAEEEIQNPEASSFSLSWASLVDKTVLDEIPARERKRQESIFELINTEIAYVRDLQLIVEVFYSTILPLLSGKEVTVIFANIEDILLTNTAFLSSLEKHQKDCRLYIDKIGDILLSHIPNMGMYMEYCVNQSVAIKVLQSVRESKPELATQLQRLRDDNPAVRNLDLSSYLLIPMQRITRYPLLIKQIWQYTDVGKEQEAIFNAREMAESLLDHINETIREQENQETLKQVSQNLWIGHARLDLTAATRNMGTRRLLKEGVLFKAKSGRKLRAFLCSDILLLTDEGIKCLYRLPIQLAYAYLKESSRSRDETGFQIVPQNPRNGETVSLRASTPRECQQWIQEINRACKKARQAEERAAQLLPSS